jgi:hypothetical protein
MALLRIAVNPTTGACIPLAPETVFSNIYFLQNYKKKLPVGPVEREREGVNEKARYVACIEEGRAASKSSLKIWLFSFYFPASSFCRYQLLQNLNHKY